MIAVFFFLTKWTRMCSTDTEAVDLSQNFVQLTELSDSEDKSYSKKDYPKVVKALTVSIFLSFQKMDLMNVVMSPT